jgi:hypothetical protein
MERPMRLYGLTLFERFLSDYLTLLGWALVALAIAATAAQGFFDAGGFTGGLLVAASFLGGLLLILGSSGIRQNRSAMDLAYGVLIVVTAAWLVTGAWSLTLPSLVAGLVLVVALGLAVYLRILAVEARFRPRELSLRQFETLVAIADTLIEGEGDEVMQPIEVAINIDAALARIEAPLKSEIKTVLVIVEWLLPLRILRPFPFSSLGSNDRRRAVDVVVGSTWVFRDVARFLKLLAILGYYSTDAARRSVGYIPFEERDRGKADQTPGAYPEPVLIQVIE